MSPESDYPDSASRPDVPYEESLEDLYENAPCGYLSVLADGTIVKTNRTFARWLGYSTEDLVGRKRFVDLLSVPGKIFHETHYRPLLHMQGAVYEIALSMVTREGRSLPVLLNATQKTDARGQLLCTRVMVLNATQRRAYEREILLERRKAEQAAKAKADFIATASHEIRNHLHAIGAVSQLLATCPGEQDEESLALLESASTNLLNLVDDILDYSKLESGKLALEQRRFDLRDLLDSAASGLRARADLKGISLQVELDERIPVALVGDAIKLTQVLTNLGGNAIKFTERGAVTLSAHLEELGPTSVSIRFEVRDTGIGIPPDQLATIFEEYAQASQQGLRSGGTGLGLSISRKILELYGSRMAVESSVGKGSTFSFGLQLPIADPPAPRHSDLLYQDATPLQGLRVLVAEADEGDALAIARLLERWGVAFDVVKNARDAAERVEHTDYDLVLMDVQLPELDGRSAAHDMRRLSKRPSERLPIIALSNTVEVYQRARLTSAGFTDLLAKPFQPEALFRSLSTHGYVCKALHTRDRGQSLSS